MCELKMKKIRLYNYVKNVKKQANNLKDRKKELIIR